MRRRMPACEGKSYPRPTTLTNRREGPRGANPTGARPRPRGTGCVRGRMKTLGRRRVHDSIVDCTKRVRGWRDALFRQGRPHRPLARCPEEERPRRHPTWVTG